MLCLQSTARERHKPTGLAGIQVLLLRVPRAVFSSLLVLALQKVLVLVLGDTYSICVGPNYFFV